MPQDMLDTSICIDVVKSYRPKLNERFNRLAEQLCISTITLAELQSCAEKSARRLDDLEAIRQFAARLAILPFTAAAAAHYGEIRARLERAATPTGAPGGHLRHADRRARTQRRDDGRHEQPARV